MTITPSRRDEPPLAPIDAPNAGRPPPTPDPPRRRDQDEPITKAVAWREGTLTRATELEALTAWTKPHDQSRTPEERESIRALRVAIGIHLAAARSAATASRPRRSGSRLERAMSNLDAAEADLLQIAPADYLIGQMPSIVNHVQRHLQSSDPRRVELERIAKRLAADRPHDPETEDADEKHRDLRRRHIELDRGIVVSAVRGASSAALREQTRVRSFRNVVVLTAAGMTIVAIMLAVVGALSPTTIPLCFAPEEGDQVTIVCPTEQSGPVPLSAAEAATEADIDALVNRTVSSWDITLVELLGLTAAAIAAAAAIRGIRGSSEPYGVPLALALLKLPTGAVTAVLGLLLMRGQFVPGLSALDTSAQILAWGAIFGYAQQLFTRLVDQQAHAVLDGVRGGDKSNEPSKSA